MSFTFDYKEQGLKKIFKDYEISALNYLWGSSKKQTSRNVWKHVNQVDGIKVSRASIINFLNQMVDEGFLITEETTGKGGHRNIYEQKFDRKEFITEIATILIQSLMTDFKEETISALQKFVRTEEKTVHQESDITEVFNDILLDFIQLEKATIDEIYTVSVKFHDIETDKETIRQIMEIVSSPPLSIADENNGEYILKPNFLS
jgi:predicted transcriptional regulator